MTDSTMSYPAITPLQILARFFVLAEGHCNSGARVAAKLLLGMYNGTRFPFDITELRCLDQKHLDMALQLIRFDASPKKEVHEWLNQIYGRTDFGERFEHLAHKWRMKGKCPKALLTQVAPIDFSTDTAGVAA